ncbi:MAG: hypothetical protein ACI4B5_07140 [Bacteroidaceae bacterium]
MTSNRWWQNRIAESRLTLPVSVVLFLAIRYWPSSEVDFGANSQALWCILTAAIMLQVNVEFQLLRVRSHLPESLCLLLSAILPCPDGIIAPMISALCLMASMGLLMGCYQNRDSVMHIFHSFFFLGVGSLFTPFMLMMALLFYISLALLMRAFSWRGFWAGMVGFITPYWCWLMWEVCLGNKTRMLTHLSTLWQDMTADESMLQLPHASLLPMWLLLLFLSLVGIIHYMRKRYEDKIRTRMMLYVFVHVTVLLHVAFLLFPAQRPQLLAMLSVSVSPLVAHYWATTGGRVGQVVLLASLLGWGATLLQAGGYE